MLLVCFTLFYYKPIVQFVTLKFQNDIGKNLQWYWISLFRIPQIFSDWLQSSPWSQFGSLLDCTHSSSILLIFAHFFILLNFFCLPLQTILFSTVFYNPETNLKSFVFLVTFNFSTILIFFSLFYFGVGILSK